MTWTFLQRRAVLAMHEEQLRRNGGAYGIRDDNAFESALARAENKAVYGDPTVFELTAAYLFGLARNHAFVDGNKRTALVAALTFLGRHGYRLTANDRTIYELVMAVAAGEIDEDGAAAFFRDHAVPLEQD